jgi:hypothetical protein
MIINTYAEAKKYIKNKTIATHSQNAKYIYIENKKVCLPFYYEEKATN